jgi:cytochrome c oxidase subunit 2
VTRLRLALLGGFVLLASGCAMSLDGDTPQTTLTPQGPKARDIDGLSNAVFVVAGLVGLFVMAGAVFVMLKFRERKDDDGSLPPQVHGHTKAEIGWTIAPAIILVVLAVFTIQLVLKMAEIDEEAMTIDVYGQQWWWSYEYDVDGDGETDIETAQDMVIPAGEEINLRIHSRDVIHSFWIPALNGKKDAVPGRVHDWAIEADAPGTYVGQCTEFCGLSHAYMRMTTIALEPAEFEAWVEHQLEEAAEPEDGTLAAEGKALFVGQCATCHLIEGVNDEANAEDEGVEPYNGAEQVAGVAPNLTHFASRAYFAGAIFNLWEDSDDSGIIEYDEIGQELNRVQLEAWLRNPSEEKPMAPDDLRGMPDLGLSEAQIDALVAYLESLE